MTDMKGGERTLAVQRATVPGADEAAVRCGGEIIGWNGAGGEAEGPEPHRPS